MRALQRWCPAPDCALKSPLPPSLSNPRSLRGLNPATHRGGGSGSDFFPSPALDRSPPLYSRRAPAGKAPFGPPRGGNSRDVPVRHSSCPFFIGLKFNSKTLVANPERRRRAPYGEGSPGAGRLVSPCASSAADRRGGTAKPALCGARVSAPSQACPGPWPTGPLLLRLVLGCL